jgi:AraC-like DNA-binding protein
MILRRRIPDPPLSRFVDFLWYYQDWEGTHSMEQVLPDGAFDLVINLRDGERKLFDRENLARHTGFRGGWLSGTHSRYIVIDTVSGASMIGAHFKPGGAASLMGSSAAPFRDQVVELEHIWGAAARELRERLLAAAGPSEGFQVLELFLTQLLKPVGENHPRQERIEWATRQFCRQPQIRTVRSAAEVLGISHKHFIAQFEEQVGLTPKLFCRIRRFQQVLAQINLRRSVDWARVAGDCGYFDQAHLVKDFQAFAGLNPSAYRSLSEEYANFVPVAEPR